jgi:hypothetical protein
MDLVRLAIIGLTLFLLYNAFCGSKSPVANSGSVVMSAGAVTTPTHIVENESVETAPDGTFATGADPYACKPAPTPYSTMSSDDKNVIGYNENTLPYPQVSNNYVPQPEFDNSMTSICDPNDPNYFNNQVLGASDLLPQDNGYNTWNESSPQTQGNLSDQNFLASGHHYGINTVGSSLRNPSYDLRSSPPIPRVAVGPWSQSTIESDSNRKTFEIGSC